MNTNQQQDMRTGMTIEFLCAGGAKLLLSRAWEHADQPRTVARAPSDAFLGPPIHLYIVDSPQRNHAAEHRGQLPEESPSPLVPHPQEREVFGSPRHHSNAGAFQKRQSLLSLLGERAKKHVLFARVDASERPWSAPAHPGLFMPKAGSIPSQPRQCLGESLADSRHDLGATEVVVFLVRHTGCEDL